MNARPLCPWLPLFVLAVALAGAAPPVVEVQVVQPVVREVADYEDFTGRAEPSALVHLVARVNGYLDKVLFKDGAVVKQGDLLFEIDPRPYKANLEKAVAAINLAEAQLKKASADLRRAKALFERKGVSKEELDKLASALEEAEGRLLVARAERAQAGVNLSYTKVTAPIGGRISRRLVDPGNLVKQDETTLATLVSTDRMYVYFDVDERTVLRLRRAGKGGHQAAAGLADEKDFPRRATVDYTDTQLDPKTGTLRMRVALPNPDGLLVPGLFVRVRLTTSEPFKTLLIPERAVFRVARAEPGEADTRACVLNRKGEVEFRDVQLGSRYGGLVVVKSGLTATDWVVFGGQGRLRPGMAVRPKKVAVSGAEK